MERPDLEFPYYCLGLKRNSQVPDLAFLNWGRLSLSEVRDPERLHWKWSLIHESWVLPTEEQ